MAEKKKRKGGKKNGEPSRSPKLLLAGLFIFIGACAGWLMLKPSQVLVPAVVGKTETEARRLVESSGLSLVVQVQNVDQTDQDGKVLTQDPPSGSSVARMSVVTITLAKGPEGVTVPDLVGKTRSEAEDELVRVALKVEFQEKKSDTIPVGRVISHTPAAGEKAPRQGTVVLVISGGVGDISVPDLTNFTVDEARETLERLGLSLDVSEVAQDDFREGDTAYILRQEPGPGELLSAGSRVRVFIPIPPPVGGGNSAGGGSASHAPRFEGLTVGAAKALAAEQGVILELADSAEDSRLVTFQDPPPGDPLGGSSASVVIRVSDSAVVPRLSGLSESQARARLEKAGLSVGTIRRGYGDVAGEVIDQRPSSGIEAISGSSVDIVISDPDAPPSTALGPTPAPDFTPAPWVE